MQKALNMKHINGIQGYLPLPLRADTTWSPEMSHYGLTLRLKELKQTAAPLNLRMLRFY